VGGYRDAKWGDGFVFGHSSSHSPEPATARTAARTTAGATTRTAASATAGCLYLGPKQQRLVDYPIKQQQNGHQLGDRFV